MLTPVRDDSSAPLQEILEHLRRMDRRDKLRTWGGFFHGMFSLIPIAIVVWSTWYFYVHGAELMQTLMQSAAQQAANATVNATKQGAVNDTQAEIQKLLKGMQK